MSRKLNQKYDHTFLKTLSRAQLQAHAKRHKIKANGKTADIIAQLLGKDIHPEAGQTSISTRPKRKGGARTKVGRRPIKTEERSVVLLPPPAPQTPKKSIPPREAAPSPSSIAMSREIEPSSGRAKSVRESYRQGTPYPQTKPRAGPSSGEPSGSTIPDERVQPCTDYVWGGDYPLNADQPTDHDIRVIRQRITAMVDEQVFMQGKIDELKLALEATGSSVESLAQKANSLSWKRVAIEEAVMLEFKDDKHLWDGTVQIESDAQRQWREFNAEYWRGPPRRTFPDRVSAGPAREFDDDSEKDAWEASRELLPEELILVDEDDDAEDL